MEVGNLDEPGRRMQYLATFSASLGALAAGTVVGYSSPVNYQFRHLLKSANLNITDISPNLKLDLHHDISLESLQKIDMPDSNSTIVMRNKWNFDNRFTLDTVQIAWFSSAYSLGALVGAILSNPLCYYLGRRKALMFSAIPAMIGWALIGFSMTYEMLVVGRVVTGLIVGINAAAANTYIGEIASPDIRGYLGTSYYVMYCAGILYAYAFGTFLKWYELAFICSLPAGLGALLMFFSYETPPHLIHSGRYEEAKEALQYFRGKHYNIDREFKEMKVYLSRTEERESLFTELRKPYVYKPLLIVIGVILARPFCGVYAILAHLSSIFDASSSHFSVNVSSIICATVELIAGIFGGLLVESAGRKSLIILSSAGMAVSLMVLGSYFFMLNQSPTWTKNTLSWVPLTSLMVYLLLYSLGIGTVPNILIGEMFSPSVKEEASALVVGVLWGTNFIMVFAFEPLMQWLLPFGLYWLLSSFCVCTAIFSVVFVKETKGKSLQEIAAMFGGPMKPPQLEIADEDDMDVSRIDAESPAVLP